MTTQKKIPHPDFALRMQQACEGNPDVPAPNYGRLGWFVHQMEHRFGVNVTQETVRKWFAGESRPRPRMLAFLARILNVDEAWLSIGRAQDVSDKELRIRSVEAGGAVNVVAGFIQLCGGNPAFPVEDDKRATKEKIDLYAIIKGAQYAMHVTVGYEDTFSVPVAAKDTVVIGVAVTSPVTANFVELDWERIEEVGTRKGSVIAVPIEFPWRKIETFAERL